MTATLTAPRPGTTTTARNGTLRERLAGHTGGLRTHPAAYERRTTAFLDQALELKETP